MPDAGVAAAETPHVLLFPFPAQGHVPPMLKLAELISISGVHVTFLNTENIHGRFLRSSPDFTRLSGRPNFRFRTIPDGLPDDDPRPFLGFLELESSLRTRAREPYRALLDPAGGWPRVTCVIADGILRLAVEVAEETEVPIMLMRTSTACSVWAYCSIPELIDCGELPFQEEADLDELVRGVKGMGSFLRRRDLPSFLLRNAKSTSDMQLQYLITISNNLSRARALILNTVEQLDAATLSCIRSVCPVTYTVGPLQLLRKSLNDVISSDSPPSSSTNASLWREDRSCMTWLDRQARKSVVYVSFGSITLMSQETLLEFWHGLVNSGHPFLWVIRPDMIQGGGVVDANQIIPGGTIEKCCIVQWAPQEEVLAHTAVGCFLTHSGWNSTIESIVAGVPMICWPFVADQQINSRFVSEIWKVGIDMKDTGGRSVVERMVRSVMAGEEAEKLQRTARETAEMVKMSAEEGGTSYVNFQNLIQHIKSLSVHRPTN